MSALSDQITEVLRAHPRSDDGYCWKCRVPYTDAHVAERIEAAMREDGIVGFVRNNTTRAPRIYTDADAEAWADE